MVDSHLTSLPRCTTWRGESELDLLPRLSESVGNALWLKREDCQPVFSFKLRGAYNKMVRMDAEARKKGVVCSSAGNHAQGVAMAAAKLGCSAVICMPVTTPDIKVTNENASTWTKWMGSLTEWRSAR
eukprot:jgi/Pico_ML_1/54887/g741.t1